MSFADQLQEAKGDLTARQVASAVSPLLSVRTVEDWLAERRSPPAWTQEWILSRVHPPRKARRAKCQNTKIAAAARISGSSANKLDAFSEKWV